MKLCPACETVYPSGDIHCPHDGAELVLAEPDDGASSFDSLTTIQPTLVSGAASGANARSTDGEGVKSTDGVGGSLLTLALARGDEALSGQILAERYRLERPIGRGGMGIVYAGRHLLLDRTIAVKLLRPQMLADDRALKRFTREAQAMALIEHPNAVTIHDFGVLSDGAAFLVMEFIEGETLRSVLMRECKISLEATLAIIEQVAGAVEAAHRQGVLHRDLKPENVMFKRTDAGPVVKVVDFGLAKVLDANSSSGRGMITAAGELFGTPVYMAPEFFEGDEVTASADIYALAVTVYEMLAGHPPFTGTVQTVMSGHLFKEPPSILESSPLIPTSIDRVLRKALCKKGEDRFQSAVEFAACLRKASYDLDVEDEIEAIPVGDEDVQANEFDARSAVVDARPESDPQAGHDTDGAAADVLVVSPLDLEPYHPPPDTEHFIRPEIAHPRNRLVMAVGAATTVLAVGAVAVMVLLMGPFAATSKAIVAVSTMMAPRSASPTVASQPPSTAPPENGEPTPTAEPRPRPPNPRSTAPDSAKQPDPKAGDAKGDDKDAKKTDPKKDPKQDNGKKKKKRWFNPFSW